MRKGNAKKDCLLKRFLPYYKKYKETFTYRLSEVKGAVKGMVYSDAVYEVKFRVTVNEYGIIEIIYNDNPVPVNVVNTEFTNIYEGDPDIPETGENAITLPWFLLLIAGAGCLSAIAILGKKADEIED